MEIMEEIQIETQKQTHLGKMIEIEEKNRKKVQKASSVKEIEAKKNDEFLRTEEERSKTLYNEMVSDVAASNLQLPPSFIKLQKNNESKISFIYDVIFMFRLTFFFNHIYYVHNFFPLFYSFYTTFMFSDL